MPNLSKIDGIGRAARMQKQVAMRRQTNAQKFHYVASGGIVAEDTMKNENGNENLPATLTTGFALAAIGGGALQLSPELAAELDESDRQGYEAPRETLPIASIRQKDAKNDNGKTIAEAGGFRMYDPIAIAGGIAIEDIPNEVGLMVTILADQTSRTLWLEGNFERPDCKSFDGLTGQGNPGGRCEVCPMSQWHDQNRPACTENRNLLIYDHTIHASYVLRLGRSGLKPYGLFKTLVKRGGAATATPIHSLVIRVGTLYETQPAPHYVPTFEIVSQVDLETFRMLKAIRTELSLKLAKTAEVTTVDDEHPAGAQQNIRTGDAGGELPNGVEPVGNALKDEDLPF